MPQYSSTFDFNAVLRAGDHIAWPQGTGEPTGLTSRLIAQGPELPACTLVLGMVTTPTLDGAGARSFSHLCLNGAANTRKAASWSRNRIIPAHVSDLPELFNSRRIPVDVVLLRVRPTDDPGIYSLGAMVDFVHEMVGAARLVIAELDERMPLTAQDALIASERIHILTQADAAEPLMQDAQPTAADLAVAERVAGLIPDRATVQFGVGGLPTAVCAALANHKGLGLHSGVIPDAAIDLITSGVIDNLHKGLDEGVTVTGGLFGSRRLMDFAHQNPQIAMRRATYTHSAATLMQLRNLYTINSAIEIDLSGQVNSEVAGSRYVGAVGGQIDYVRGGKLSPGGRSIIAMASTTGDAKHSKIVLGLGGRPVTTARSDVDLVVTEFGVADLWGRDFQARSEALITVAHPAFRASLANQLEEELARSA